MKILFMGTPNFALSSLSFLVESFDIVGVVCQPDRPAGRGRKLTPPPTKLFAIQRSINVFQPTKKEEIVNIVEETDPECIVVVAYGKILPVGVIRYPRYGCINLHASLLPKYRGSAPIQRALMNSEKFTGSTVMLMDEGMDTGPILSQKKEPILEEDNAITLADRLAASGAHLLLDTLKEWFEGNIKPKPQDDRDASYAPLILKEEYRICWKAEAQSVHDRVRGLYPNCYAYLENGERIKVLKTRIVQAEGDPGKIIDRERFIVACGKDGVEVLELISPKGKKLRGSDFMLGYGWSEFVM